MLNQKPSILVYNVTDKRVLLKTNADIQRPIASITKLVTAMVILDDCQDLNERLILVDREHRPLLNYDPEYRRTSYQLPEQSYTRQELLTAMLVTSDNNAAETLAENYSKGYNQCVQDLNTKALAVGATDTFFNEPHGCFADNKSTLMDLSQIITASAQYNSILSLNRITNTTLSDVYIENANNYLLLQFPEMIKICKTGLNISAGYSLSMLVEKNDKLYTVTILGTNTYQERFDVAKKLLTSVIR